MSRPAPHPVTGERADLGDLLRNALDLARLVGRRGGEDLRTEDDIRADWLDAPDALVRDALESARDWKARLAEVFEVTPSDVERWGSDTREDAEWEVERTRLTRDGFLAAGFCPYLHHRLEWVGRPSAYVRERLAAVVG